MKLYGIPAKIINITESLYKNNRCTVRTEEGLSDWFQVETGVKQGCIMSPLLFGIAVDFIMRKCTKEQTGILWTDGKQLEDLDFADDIALISDTSENMQKKTTKLAEIAEKVGLQISHEKTKVMRNAICGDNNNRIQLGEQMIEEVTQFTYLGSCIDHNGELKKEIQTRIAKAATAFRALEKIWTSKILSTKTKLRIFNSNIISILIYACECWKVTREIENRLNSFENKCLRKILQIKWNEFKTSQEVRETSGQPLISDVIRRRRWKYIGHVCRRDNSRITKQALNWEAEGKRKRGRPRETLKRTILREAERVGLESMDEVVAAAQDRKEWRKTLEALCAV